MRVSDFSYELPPELIAQDPVIPRDSARLLVYRRETQRIEHHTIQDLPDLLPERTHIIANNSKVRHSRLFALYPGRTKQIEILILENVAGSTYRCLLRGHNLKIGTALSILHPETRQILCTAEIREREETPGIDTFLLVFSVPEVEVERICEQYGLVPLPPYITSSHSQPDQYQTVFAQHLGSAAAPTAGLHFTPGLLEKLKSNGFTWSEVTLHVGMGTFLPLKHDELTENRLHQEQTEIFDQVAHILNTARDRKEPILTIGTTSVRTVESHTREGTVIPGKQSTELFIYPGYEFKVATALVTNFHLPNSSLLALVAAFLGNRPYKGVVDSESTMIDTLHQLYSVAIAEKYRFFSFGDAMLIL